MISKSRTRFFEVSDPSANTHAPVYRYGYVRNGYYPLTVDCAQLRLNIRRVRKMSSNIQRSLELHANYIRPSFTLQRSGANS